MDGQRNIPRAQEYYGTVPELGRDVRLFTRSSKDKQTGYGTFPELGRLFNQRRSRSSLLNASCYSSSSKTLCFIHQKNMSTTEQSPCDGWPTEHSPSLGILRYSPRARTRRATFFYTHSFNHRNTHNKATVHSPSSDGFFEPATVYIILIIIIIIISRHHHRHHRHHHYLSSSSSAI